MEDPKIEALTLEDIPANSFIVLTVDVPGPMEKYHAADGMVGQLNQYKDIFKNKKLTLFILTPKESIDVLTEEEMGQAGWVRKLPQTLTGPKEQISTIDGGYYTNN